MCIWTPWCCWAGWRRNCPRKKDSPLAWARRWPHGCGFFALAYGARLLAPLFTRPTSWRVLDISVALVMLIVAYQLLQG